MQKYKYTAVDLQKHKIKGVFIAKDEADLAEQLAKQSLFLISAKPYTGGTSGSFFSFEQTVTIKELTGFCRQYAIMLNTHIPILDCLDILKNQPYTNYFKNVISVIYEDVESGILLSEALEKHKNVFPDFFRSMIKVGEISGHLDAVLNSLAEYYETESENRRKIKSALSYPMMLMGMTVGIVVLMLAVVVPTFRDTLSKLNVEPEGLTAAIYAISDFLLNYWQILLLVILGVVLAIMLVNRTEKGKYFFDVCKLTIPVIKTIQINTITSRFARAFALLLSSGLDLNEALNATEIVIGNRYLSKRFHEAAEAVRGGMSLTNAFESYRLFPPMMVQMITIGEKTNALDDVLTRSCKFFDDQVEISVNSLTNKLQPLMLLIMGAVIITLFLAVYSPILSIMTGLNV
ncbi:MAG: type II secretion system F family protein [Ruminococcaceae bacterium]|nr:type II secretion system F family protein [Oscillospiraceae bacterium]